MNLMSGVAPHSRPLSKAEAALWRLEAAGSFEEASSAWEDFLVFWVLALHKIDASGRRKHRAGWPSISVWVEREPVLQYLWAARNADHHSLAAIAGLALGEMQAPTVRMDVDPTLRFEPAKLRLLDLVVRGKQIEVPTRFGGMLLAFPGPVIFAGIGLDFAANAASWSEADTPPPNPKPRSKQPENR